MSRPRCRETPDCARPRTPVSSVTFSRSRASTRSSRSRASSPSSRYSAEACLTSINLHVLISVVKRPRPVVLEQARQRPVRQQPAAGLAARAVVALVRRVPIRCTGAPHTGQGCLKRPCTAISGRNAVTFSGNPPRASSSQPLDPQGERRARRVVQAAISASVSDRVSLSGDSRAAWRISSEYALPMPLKQMRIGQRALQRVVLARRAPRETPRASRRAARGRPDRAREGRPAPRTRCSDARFFEPASVKSSVPFANSNDASISFGPSPALAPGSRHRSRPAIIRCMTRNSSSSSAMTMRLPTRKTSRTRLPLHRIDRTDRPSAGRTGSADAPPRAAPARTIRESAAL